MAVSDPRCSDTFGRLGARLEAGPKARDVSRLATGAIAGETPCVSGKCRCKGIPTLFSTEGSMARSALWVQYRSKQES